jgi:adenosylhomocysteine nucleosidase
MIAILGSSHDDILYFENVIMNKSETMILSRFKAYTGNIFNQEVIVVQDIYTSNLASIVTNQILNDYHIDLVINVGRCVSLDKANKSGDVVISNKIYDADIDFTTEQDVLRYQIPGYEKSFNVQHDVIQYLEKGIAKRPFVKYYQAAFLSTDDYSDERLESLNTNRMSFGIEDKLVIDHNVVGVALASSLKGVPYIAIKVIENKYDKDHNVDTYLTVLTRYIDLGKAVASMIGDIGRNDILDKRGY